MVPVRFFAGTGLEETFVAGFMLIDKLGLSARVGLSLVVRQTFYGFWFALVDQKLDPRPNYWLSLAFKRLVGQRVLAAYTDTSPPERQPRVRVYAHCASKQSGYTAGSVVVYAMNICNETSRVFFNVSNSHVVNQFLFTAPQGNLTSTAIELNGELVSMVSDTQLPTFKAQRVVSDSGVEMPPYSIAFYVINVNAKACR